MLARSVILTTAVQISTTLTTLGRSIIFAHILSPNDYSLAMTFGVIILFCEIISNFGHDSLIVRSKHGDTESFQATLHASVLLRGIIISLVLLALSPRIPEILAIQDSDFNFAWLALIPLINGFVHLDFQRITRHFDYSISAKVTIFSDIASIIVGISLALIYENHWAYLISMIARHLIYILLSHFFATRKYRVSIDSSHVREIVQFGGPILLISGLRYLCLEADKVIVVRYLGLLEFTSYALSMLVIRQVTSLSTLGYTKIFIRRISQNVSKHEQSGAYKTNAIVLLFITTPLIFALAVAGESLISIAFGKQYQATLFLVPVICGLVSIRLCSYWLNVIVMASDHTSKMLLCTTLSLIGFMLGLYAAMNGLGSIVIVASFIAGELIYVAALTYLLKPSRPELPGLTMLFILLVSLNILLATTAYWYTYQMRAFEKFFMAGFCAFLVIGLFLVTSTTIRDQIKLAAKELKLIRS